MKSFESLTQQREKKIIEIKSIVSQIHTLEEAISYIDTTIQDPDLDTEIKELLIRWKNLLEYYQKLDKNNLVDKTPIYNQFFTQSDKFGFGRILREYIKKNVPEIKANVSQQETIRNILLNPTFIENDTYNLLQAGFSNKEIFLALNYILSTLWYKSNRDFNKILSYIDTIHPYYENFRYLCTEASKPEIGLDELGIFEIRVKNLLHAPDFDDEYNLSQILSVFVLSIWEKSHSPRERVMDIPDETKRKIRDAFYTLPTRNVNKPEIVVKLDNYIIGLSFLIRVLEEQKLDSRQFKRLLSLIEENKDHLFRSINNPNNYPTIQILQLINSLDFNDSLLRGILVTYFPFR